MTAEILKMPSKDGVDLDKVYDSLMQNYRDNPPQLSHTSNHVLTVLEVNFDAIAYNYLRIKQEFYGRICAAVVKCDAYGIGAENVSKKLYSVGCRHFFVATLDEAVAIRMALPEDAEILVFSGVLPGTEDIFVEYNFTPVLIDLLQVKRWQAYARQIDRKLPSALHIDTGMNRTGLCQKELAQLKDNPEWVEPLELRYVMSHLACSPLPNHPLNAQQLHTFLNACSGFPSNIIKSLSSSEGIFLGPEYHHDMARPGLALYGFNLSNIKMVPALRFWSRILHIHNVNAGDTVGYGGSHRFEKDGKVAVLSAGYYHGWLRSLGNKGEVYIAGHKAPMVGPVSMDLCTVDVSNIPESDLVLNGWVELSGQHIPLRQLARDAGTITTEMITLLSRNTNRLYVGKIEDTQ